MWMGQKVSRMHCLKQYNIIWVCTIASFFHVVTLIFNANGATFFRIPLWKMILFVWQASWSNFEWTKYMISQWGHIRTLQSMLHFWCSVVGGVSIVHRCMCVCGRALSCNSAETFVTIALCFAEIAGVTWSWRIPLSRTLFTVVPLPWWCSRICPCESQKSVNITFPADGSVLNFFLTGDVRCLQSIPWCFLCGSYGGFMSLS
jgi:hypothetical protein